MCWMHINCRETGAWAAPARPSGTGENRGGPSGFDSYRAAHSLMASVWKHPNSPFWTACFTNETGKQVKRSTKTEDRELALQMAESFEAAARQARGAELTRTAAVKLLNDLLERTQGEGLDARSTRRYFTDHLASLEARGTKDSTLKRYRPIFESFLAHLGESRASARLASVTAQEVAAYHAAELKAGKTPGAAAYALKVLHGVFEDARHQAVISANPVCAL